ncbi:hypothetical protein RJF_0637 [Candidozyma auris]|nr:hypothetical protein CAJCM15448_09030 [[Candida] auris]
MSENNKELDDLRKLRSVLAAVKQTVDDIKRDIQTAVDNKDATSEELGKLEAVIKKI